MNSIGPGGDSLFKAFVHPTNKSAPPAPVNPPTTGGATEVPSGAITVPSTTSDQFVSIGNRAVVNSGLVTSTNNDKKGDWDSFAVAVEPGTDANPVLPLALNMKSEATIKLTELPPKGNESVTAEFMKIAGTTGTNGTNASIVSRIINDLT